MKRNFTLIGSTTLICVSLLCAVVSLATDHWVDYSRSHVTLNPKIENDEFRNSGEGEIRSSINYQVSNYGMWIACYMEEEGAKSCAFINGACKTNVCWTRESETSKATTCKSARIEAVRSCDTLQATRALFCIGTLLLTVASSLAVVSCCTHSRTLAATGGFFSFTSGLVLMSSFGLLFGGELSKHHIVGKIATVGYSLILLCLAWPSALLAGLLSCFSASVAGRPKELSEYSTSVM